MMRHARTAVEERASERIVPCNAAEFCRVGRGGRGAYYGGVPARLSGAPFSANRLAILRVLFRIARLIRRGASLHRSALRDLPQRRVRPPRETTS